MQLIRSERLIIVVLDAHIGHAAVKGRSRAKALIKHLTVLAERDVGNSDVAKDRQPLPKSEVACYCFLRDDLSDVGNVSSKWLENLNACYVGYTIYPKFRGQGYASEAARAVCQWLLSNPEVKAIISETFPDSTDSLKVMGRIGMRLVDANLGPNVVRHVLIREGEGVDLVEHEVVDLKPYRLSLGHSYRHVLWRTFIRLDVLVVVSILIEAIIVNLGRYSSLITVCLLAGYLIYLFEKTGLRRLRGDYLETLIQLRSSGLFYANRAGFGSVFPWKSFSKFRCPRGGGIEIWNGRNWFWIPPAAFDAQTLKRGREFLVERGLVDIT